MRIARIGSAGQEKPAVVTADEYILVDSLIGDWSRESLETGAIRIFATGKEYLSFGSLISSALDSWLWSRLDHLSIYCLLR